MTTESSASLSDAQKERILKFCADDGYKNLKISVTGSYPQKKLRHHDNVFRPVLETTTIIDSTPGTFGVLPNEILFKICEEMSVCSAVKFAQTNRACRKLLASTPSFRRILRGALECVRVMLQTNAGEDISIATLQSIMVSRNCALCGNYGALIFLPASLRCCASCLEANRSELQVVDFNSLRYRHRVQLKRYVSDRSLLSLIHVPDPYSPRLYGTIIQTRPLFSLPRAKELFLANRGHVQFLGDITSCKALNYLASTWLPVYSLITDQIEQDLQCVACRDKSTLLDAQDEGEGWIARKNRIYSTSSFLEHYLQCKYVKRFSRTTRLFSLP